MWVHKQKQLEELVEKCRDQKDKVMSEPTDSKEFVLFSR